MYYYYYDDPLWFIIWQCVLRLTRAVIVKTKTLAVWPYFTYISAFITNCSRATKVNVTVLIEANSQ